MGRLEAGRTDAALVALNAAKKLTPTDPTLWERTLSLALKLVTFLSPYNLIVTNVPGPDVPLYLLGARMLGGFPLIPLFERQGVGVAGGGFAAYDYVLWHPELGDVPRYGTAGCAAVLRDLLSNPAWKARIAEALPPEIAEEVPLDLFGLITGLPAGTAQVPWDGPEVRIIEHPAHAQGHAALLIEERGVLAAGDMLSDILIPFPDLDASNPIEGADQWRRIAVEKGYTTSTSTVALRTHLARAHAFPSTYVSEDSHTWLRVLATGTVVAFVNAALARRRICTSVHGSRTRQRFGEEFYWVKLQVDLDGFTRALAIARAATPVSPVPLRPTTRPSPSSAMRLPLVSRACWISPVATATPNTPCAMRRPNTVPAACASSTCRGLRSPDSSANPATSASLTRRVPSRHSSPGSNSIVPTAPVLPTLKTWTCPVRTPLAATTWATRSSNWLSAAPITLTNGSSRLPGAGRCADYAALDEEAERQVVHEAPVDEGAAVHRQRREDPRNRALLRNRCSLGRKRVRIHG